MNQVLMEKIESLIQPVISEFGAVMVDLAVKYGAGQTHVEILADKPQGGITMGECAALNSQISKLIEGHQLIAESYTVEVSSPGLDRPLRTQKDFQRVINQPIICFLSQPVDGRIEYSGKLISVENGCIVLEQNGLKQEIPLGSINKGKQIIQEG